MQKGHEEEKASTFHIKQRTPIWIIAISGFILVSIVPMLWMTLADKNDSSSNATGNLRKSDESEESSEYLYETSKTAVAANMDAAEFRAEIAKLAKRCQRDKEEIHSFVRKLGRQTYDTRAALAAVPGLCDASASSKLRR